jgi:PhnB protein
VKKDLQLLPYLTFAGTARQAMEFYKQVFGGELTISTYGETYGDEVPAADKNVVMHAALETEFLSLMGNDTVPGMETKFGDNVRINLTGTDASKIGAYFQKLSEGATVIMPFEKQVWGQELGMLIDKFGTYWLVSVR